MKLRLLFFILFLHFGNAYADVLEKGFERLRVYDYFQAKSNFEKAIKKRTAGAAYGLSLIYVSNNNPFYNLDSARVYILMADSSLRKSSSRQLESYLSLGITATAIAIQKDAVCKKAFQAAEHVPSVEKINSYLTDFNFCAEVSQAVELRNEVAFNDARVLNTAAAYLNFMHVYPEAGEMQQAKSFYEERLYDELTADKNLAGYHAYIKKYPDGPFKLQAERKIYQLSTSNHTLKEYDEFIRANPSSSFVEEAWRELYKLAMKDFNESAYASFRQNYPNYPFMDELEQDYKLMNSQLLPFQNNGLWGYINEDGKEIIKPVYEENALFSEGLAAVKLNGKFGYINKSGKTIIPFNFDEAERYKNKTAVVASHEKFGLINHHGDTLIPLIYDDLSDPVDDICIAILDDQSGFLMKTGQKITDFIYDFAGEFQDGYAIVAKDEKFGMILKNGTISVKPQYDQLLYISNGLFRAKLDGKWGIISGMGETRVPFLYQIISEFSEGKALASRNGKCGFIDLEGSVKVPFQYTYAENLLNTARFKNGYVLIRQKTKSVLLDSTGNKINLPGYEDVGMISSSLVPVKKNKKWGYATPVGKLKISCKFQQAGTFEDGYANITLKGLSGIIDTTGNINIPTAFQDVVIRPGCFVTKKNGLYGLKSRQGNELLPESYDAIEFISDKIILARKGETKTYLNIQTGRIILKDN